MGRVAESVMYLRKMRLLELVTRFSASGGEGARLSMKAMASALGLAPCQIRCLVRSLESDDMVVVFSRFDEKGARLANAYTVTPKGRVFLAARTAAEGKGRNRKEGK